jgi:TolB protein
METSGRLNGPPDSQTIAFVSGASICLMKSDGSDPRQLLTLKGTIFTLSWAPDGRAVAFDLVSIGKNAKNDSDIYTLDINGASSPRLLIKNGYDPSWSPDARMIAFSSFRDKTWGIYVINVHGSTPRQLIAGKAANEMPVWSPDGRAIAFASDQSGRYEIYLMNADGSGIRQLTSHKGQKSDCFAPTWSPDSSQIAFSCNDKNDREIFVIESNATNGAAQRITRDGGRSPDFIKIAANP